MNIAIHFIRARSNLATRRQSVNLLALLKRISVEVSKAQLVYIYPINNTYSPISVFLTRRDQTFYS